MTLELIILLLSVVFIFNWWAHGYWKRRNVFSPPTEFLFGNTRKLLMGKTTIFPLFNDIHKKYKKYRMIGFYFFYKPMLYVSDPEIIKKVLVTEFSSFSDNGFVLSKDLDPLFGFNPFTAKTIPLWKELRTVQSLNQTPLKLREVVSNLVGARELMYDFIKNHKSQPVRVLDLSIRAAVDSAVLYGFGIEPKSFLNAEFSFMKHAVGDKIFEFGSLKMIAAFFAPVLYKLYNFRITSKEAEEFLMSVTRTSIEHRQSSKRTRGDLVDIIMKLNRKKLKQTNRGYTDLELSALSTTFYIDATTTSSTVLTFFLLELANQPDIQEKLRNEIFSVGKIPEHFDYDKIKSIAYLQMVFDEILRLHSPVTLLSRLCTKDTIVENVRISKGTTVFISPVALHFDPEYFPDPNKFDPERFSEINKQSIAKYTFLPFGDGPRICVGMKYATIFVKTLVVFILLKYRILPNENKNKRFHEYDNYLIAAKPDSTVTFEEL